MGCSWAKTRWRQAAFLAVALLALVNGGCLLAVAGVAGAGAAGFAYCKGNVCENFVADFNDAWTASHSALTELGMPILSEEHEGGSGVIQSRTADGEGVRITLDTTRSQLPTEGTLTKVGVRVATFGDYTLSERVLYQVSSHLVPATVPGQPSPPGTPTLGPVQPVAAQQAPETAPPPLLPPEPVARR